MTSFVPYGTLTFCKNCGEQNPYHRELTDEEIKKVWSNLKCNRSDSVELIFARAILKKASEK